MIRIFFLFAASLPAAVLPAAEIYSCIDGHGIQHFSEEPVTDCDGTTETFVIEDQQPDAGDDRYSVIRQLERLEKQNAELEKQRLEKQLLREQIEASRQRARAARRAAETPPAPAEPTTVVPIYIPVPHRPPHHRPRPAEEEAPAQNGGSYRPPAADR